MGPTENVWGCIEYEINQKYIRNIEDMTKEVLSYWESMSHKLIHNSIDSMSRRIQQCIEMEGGLKKSEKVNFLRKYKYVQNNRH